jgi:hypothetical protein
MGTLVLHQGEMGGLGQLKGERGRLPFKKNEI